MQITKLGAVRTRGLDGKIWIAEARGISQSNSRIYDSGPLKCSRKKRVPGFYGSIKICDGYMTSKGARRVFFTLKIIPFSGEYKGNVVPRHNSPFPSIVIVIIACY